MAIEQFKPSLWSNQVIVDVDKALVYKNIVDTSYEGEVKYGNSVRINEIGPISVSDYTVNSDITVSELTDAQVELVIDKQKYFAFKIDDVDAAQAKPEVMSKAMRKAAHAIADQVDQDIAAKYSEAGLTDDSATDIGTSASHKTVYGSDMLQVMSDMHMLLDGSNAPNAGRFVVWPYWGAALLRFAEVANQTSAATIRGVEPQAVSGSWGLLGSFYGFTHYWSANCSNDGTEYRVMFGSPDALAFVGQVQKVEAYRVEKQFADGVKGLYVYGSKVVRPDHLGYAVLELSGVST